MGVTVTFVAILELVREGLIDIVQAEPFAPLHVRAAGPSRTLRVVADNDPARAVVAEATEVVEASPDTTLDPNFIDDTSFDEESALDTDSSVEPPSPDEASS
jgi:hypothetical protein